MQISISKGTMLLLEECKQVCLDMSIWRILLLYAWNGRIKLFLTLLLQIGIADVYVSPFFDFLSLNFLGPNITLIIPPGGDLNVVSSNITLDYIVWQPNSIVCNTLLFPFVYNFICQIQLSDSNIVVGGILALDQGRNISIYGNQGENISTIYAYSLLVNQGT